jgi:hypothetical protein
MRGVPMYAVLAASVLDLTTENGIRRLSQRIQAKDNC